MCNCLKSIFPMAVKLAYKSRHGRHWMAGTSSAVSSNSLSAKIQTSAALSPWKSWAMRKILLATMTPAFR
ncbi:hypothetical protein WP1_242 [Pseudomonas phage WP1]